jgi:DoxX-like family
MTVVTTILSVLLAGLLVFSALRKLSHQERFIRGYIRVGVPEEKLDYLAFILLAGAAGLLLGLMWAPIGIAAAVGVTCYFVVAVAFHVRADDARNLPTPLALAVIAAVLLALQLATL